MAALPRDWSAAGVPARRFRDVRKGERPIRGRRSVESATATPIFLVQDYHFSLAPRVLQLRAGEHCRILLAYSLAVSTRVRYVPVVTAALDGLLGSDVVGFQTDTDCRNFLYAVALLLDAEVDLARHSVEYRGHTTVVRAYPVGVDWDNQVVRATPAPTSCRERVCRDPQLPPDVRLAVGVDRLDYTKGINEKFLAVERLLETSPELRGRFVLVQVAEPSRDSLPEYRATRAQLVETSQRVNGRFGTNSYRPIRLLEAHHPPFDVYRLYRAADLCYVGSLRDGMNLVAKEFVCARNDERGVLALSQLTGAAKQLTAALLINPHAVDESVFALRRGLAMSRAEQSWRMRHMRTNVEAFSATWWAQKLVGDATQAGWAKSPNHALTAARPHLQGGCLLERKFAESHP